MNPEQPTKRLSRPDLRMNPNKWGGAQNNTLAARVAIIAMITEVVGGIGLVFVYPYFSIDRFRRYYR